MQIELSCYNGSYKKEKVISLEVEPSLAMIPAIVALFAEALKYSLHNHCHAEILGVEPIVEAETV